jgi:hypothetical protein
MKKETIEDAAENFWRNDDSMSDYVRQAYVTGFMAGAKWMQERMYSEKELEVAFFEGRENNLLFTEWFEKLKNETK